MLTAMAHRPYPAAAEAWRQIMRRYRPQQFPQRTRAGRPHRERLMVDDVEPLLRREGHGRAGHPAVCDDDRDVRPAHLRSH